MERLPQLERINYLFAITATSELTQYLGIPLHFSPASVEVVTYNKLLETILAPSYISIDVMPSLNNGTMLNILDMRFGYALVTKMMGGSDQHGIAEGRYFSGIEASIIDVVNRKILDYLKQAWQSAIIDFDIKHKATTYDPQLVATELSPNDEMLVITFHVEFNTTLASFKTAIPRKYCSAYMPFLESENTNIRCSSLDNEQLLHFLSKENDQRPEQKLYTFDPNAEYFSIFKKKDIGIGLMLGFELPQTIACIASFLDTETQTKIIHHTRCGQDSEIIFAMIRNLYIPQPDFIPLIDHVINTQYTKMASGIVKKTKEETLLAALEKECPERMEIIKEELEEFKQPPFGKRKKNKSPSQK